MGMLTLGIAGFARASAFAATMPLAGSGAVPRTVRAAIALMLTPAIAARLANDGAHVTPVTDLIANATIGAAFGVAATIAAAAASAAGSLIDGALALRPFGRDSVFGGDGGPFERLCSLAFGCVLFASGATTQLCARFVSASSSTAFQISAGGAVSLVRSSIESALDLASPAIAAQVIGTVVAGAVARAAPRINGLMLAAPLTTTLVLLTMLGAAAPLFAGLLAIARRVALAGPYGS